jgi:hypothetical protein
MKDIKLSDSTGRIRYLDPENLKQFATVTLISTSNDKLKINPFILAAFNPKLINLRGLDPEEIFIITEFSKEELQIFVNFCHEGLLPPPLQVSKMDSNLIFEAFGVKLDQILRTGNQSILTRLMPKVEDSFQRPPSPEIKIEYLDDNYRSNTAAVSSQLLHPKSHIILYFMWIKKAI